MGTNRKIKSDGSVEIESSTTTVSGTLSTTGALSSGSTLDVTGATTLSDTLGVTGATTLSNTLAVTGNTTVSSINNLTFPTTDGTVDQVLKTDGAGTLSFATVASGGGGGGGTDTISSQSDATSYTGTATTIVIDSTSDITLDVDLTNRQVLCSTNINLKLGGTLTNCTIKHSSSDATKYLDIGSKYRDTNTSAGADKYIRHCDISAKNVRIFNGYSQQYQSMMQDDEIYITVLFNTRITCHDLFLGQHEGSFYVRADMMAPLQSQIFFEDGCFVQCDNVKLEEFNNDYNMMGQDQDMVEVHFRYGAVLHAVSWEAVCTSNNNEPTNGGFLKTSSYGEAYFKKGVKSTSSKFYFINSEIAQDESIFLYNYPIKSKNNQWHVPLITNALLFSNQTINSTSQTKINLDRSGGVGWDQTVDKFHTPTNGSYQWHWYIRVTNAGTGTITITQKYQNSTLYTREMPYMGSSTRVLVWTTAINNLDADKTSDFYITDSNGSCTIHTDTTVMMQKHDQTE